MLPLQSVSQSDAFRHVLARDGAPVPLDTSSRSGSVIACVISCWVICGVAVAARFYARGRIQRVLGSEDWCVLAAYVSSMANGSVKTTNAAGFQLLALGYTVATIYGSFDAVYRLRVAGRTET